MAGLTTLYLKLSMRTFIRLTRSSYQRCIAVLLTLAVLLGPSPAAAFGLVSTQARIATVAVFGIAVTALIQQRVHVAINRRGTGPGIDALAKLRPYVAMSEMARGVASRYIVSLAHDIAAADPAQQDDAMDVIADLGLVWLNASHASSTPDITKLTLEKLLENCGATRTRSVAKDEAYDHAGVWTTQAFVNEKEWAWNFIFPAGMDKNSRAYTDFRSRYPTEHFYEASTGTGLYVREHPLGHLDQPGMAHHDCPHFHAVNELKQEKIIEYKPGSP